MPTKVKVPKGKRHCYKCGKNKSPKNFRKKSGELAHYCAPCRKITIKFAKAWIIKNPKRYHQNLMRVFERKYGITEAQYKELLVEQGGGCAICKTSDPSRGCRRKFVRFSIDHDHRTGQIRGLLCNQCNRALGLLLDDPEVLAQAAAYLRRPSHLRLIEGGHG